MRTTIYALLPVFLWVGWTGCSDREPTKSDPDPFRNELVIGDTVYALGYTELMRIEAVAPGVYFAPIYLCSEGIVVTSSEETGTGQVMELTVITDNAMHLEPGTYTFRDDIYSSEELIPGTFIAGVFRDWNLETWEVLGFYEGLDGTLTVDYLDYEAGLYTFDLQITANMYDIGYAGIPSQGKPLMASNVPIRLTYKGTPAQ